MATDGGPCDLGACSGSRFAHGLDGLIIEMHKVPQHPHSLVQGAVLVVWGIRILCQEIFSQQLGHFKNDLVRFGQRVLSDKLHNFAEIFLLLKNFAALCSQAHEIGVNRVIKFREGFDIVGIRNEPIDAGEVLALGELLVQTPKHLHDGQRGSGNRITGDSLNDLRE